VKEGDVWELDRAGKIKKDARRITWQVSRTLDKVV
jgi:hypothetical protein